MEDESSFKWIMAIMIIVVVVIALTHGIINSFEPQIIGGWSWVDPETGVVIWS